VHVDATDDEDETVKKLSAKYKIVGLPVLILIDSSGKEATRFNEFVPPEKFVEALKKVQ
jgi:thiol:disulfide interchange protein DsbD